MNEMKIIISGGGTGGHIFPAISIANEIQKRYPGASILFVGAQGRMEMDRVPAAGYKIKGLPIMGMPRKPGLKMFSFVTGLYKSIRKAKRIIAEFRPDIAIGVGGYASGPLLWTAVKKKVPALIQEQNSYAGITNKLLSKKVDKICVAYDRMERYFPGNKIVVTGNPVRRALLDPAVSKQEALDYFGLSHTKKTLLVVGGSLGARTLNESVLAKVQQIADSEVQIIWQTGKLYYNDIQQKLKGKIPRNLKIHQFLTKMELAYRAADLVISRAGAGTISELCLVGKPCILVPSPNVAEDHQTKNAMALTDKNAAIMVKDDKAIGTLITTSFQLIENEEQLALLSENIKRLAKPDASKLIVDEIMKLIKSS